MPTYDVIRMIAQDGVTILTTSVKAKIEELKKILITWLWDNSNMKTDYCRANYLKNACFSKVNTIHDWYIIKTMLSLILK